MRQSAENVVVIPNGTTVPGTMRRDPTRSILFVGIMSYDPNRHGVEWFIERVWPLIRHEVPDATFDVIGRNPASTMLKAHGTAGVMVHGFVDDLTPYYERAALSVAPLLAGGGTRLKILESLGRGVPVVSTAIGAYGIAAQAQHGLERADDAQTFASRCVALLMSSREEAASRALAGRELVRERYEWRKIQELVGALALNAVQRAAYDATSSGAAGKNERSRITQSG